MRIVKWQLREKVKGSTDCIANLLQCMRKDISFQQREVDFELLRQEITAKCYPYFFSVRTLLSSSSFRSLATTSGSSELVLARGL